MNKYEKQRSVHAEHISFCAAWKLEDGNDFVDEAMSLADDQAMGRHRFGNSDFNPSRAKLAQMVEVFRAKGGRIKKCVDK